jgi:hypothetical protein
MAGYTNLKTYGNSGINSHFELGLSRLEWSIYNETNIKTSAKNFCKTTLLLLEKDSKIDVSKTCQNMLRKILPVAFRAAPKAMTKGEKSLNSIFTVKVSLARKIINFRLNRKRMKFI